ncbi:MAG: hypothetical protein QOF33_1742 [Thermomicrobiales bacterium]|nr:hypothetical protein [Thermomicrobiales bacterium]
MPWYRAVYVCVDRGYHARVRDRNGLQIDPTRHRERLAPKESTGDTSELPVLLIKLLRPIQRVLYNGPQVRQLGDSHS